MNDSQPFLAICETSSAAAAAAFQGLLGDLGRATRRVRARRVLGLLFREALQGGADWSARYHFRATCQAIGTGPNAYLRLLHFPSTFEPEQWSSTFHEGLSGFARDEFEGRFVVELGAGNGWIALALARQFSPHRVLGLDINPRAVLAAKLNLYLNALDDQGVERRERDGRSLLSCVDYLQSDLLEAVTHLSGQVDRIIGCIPQVLLPETKVLGSDEGAEDQTLEALSHYYSAQQYEEDELGLGLIARALEQSVPLLADDGKLVLNLGTRPGRSALRRLMQRRGFAPRIVWQRRVRQTTDTDITSLVEIERTRGHPFEFYADSSETAAVSAATARSLQRRGHDVYHGVAVYEASLVRPTFTRSIHEVLHRAGAAGLLRVADLDSDGSPGRDARLAFLAALAPFVADTCEFEYGDVQGQHALRERVSALARAGCGVRIDATQIQVGPSRAALMGNLLRLLCPSCTLVASALRDPDAPPWSEHAGELLWASGGARQLLRLLEMLGPQVVVIGSRDVEHDPAAASELARRTRECGALLIVEVTELLDTADAHGLARASNDAAGALERAGVLLAEVGRGGVSGLELGVALSRDATLLRGLRFAAELTYSRASTIAQLHCTRPLEPSRAVRVPDRPPLPPSPRALPSHVRQAFAHAAVAGTSRMFTTSSVRLDYGENMLPAPECLKHALLEGYLAARIDDGMQALESAIGALLARRFGLPQAWYAERVYGHGVASLFSAAMGVCARERRTLFVPTGSYGTFVAAAMFHGVDVRTLKTSAASGFKIDAKGLEALRRVPRGSWLYLNAPIVNPTGLRYSASELCEILRVAASREATVLLDTVFGGLEFHSASECPIEAPAREFLPGSRHAARLVLLGGLSKELASGGLRFGYAWSPNTQLARDLRVELDAAPDAGMRHAAARVLRLLAEGDADLVGHQDGQRELLRRRAERLVACLAQNGWRPLSPDGGLFLIAKPEAYLAELGSADVVADLLFEQTGVAINGASWTGIDGHCRFALATAEWEIEQALVRLERFRELHGVQEVSVPPKAGGT